MCQLFPFLKQVIFLHMNVLKRVSDALELVGDELYDLLGTELKYSAGAVSTLNH